jgi:hypothetical protein
MDGTYNKRLLTRSFDINRKGEEILGDQEKWTFWKWKRLLRNPQFEQEEEEE